MEMPLNLVWVRGSRSESRGVRGSVSMSLVCCGHNRSFRLDGFYMTQDVHMDIGETHVRSEVRC